MNVDVIVTGIRRQIVPPIPSDGGGFWYFKNAAGAISLGANGEIVWREDQVEAEAYAREIGGRAVWMPKLKVS